MCAHYQFGRCASYSRHISLEKGESRKSSSLWLNESPKHLPHALVACHAHWTTPYTYIFIMLGFSVFASLTKHNQALWFPLLDLFCWTIQSAYHWHVILLPPELPSRILPYHALSSPDVNTWLVSGLLVAEKAIGSEGCLILYFIVVVSKYFIDFILPGYLHFLTHVAEP